MAESSELSESMDSIEHLLCPQCINGFERLFIQEEEIEEKEKRNIQQLHDQKCAGLYALLESLDDELKKTQSIWIASIIDWAKYKARKSTADPGFAGLLYDILIAEAWKAAQEYDPQKCKFSTWIYNPWDWAIKDFWKTLKETKELSLESTLADEEMMPTPSEILEAAEQKQQLEDINQHTSVIEAIWCNEAWPCPYCRRVLHNFLLVSSKHVDKKQIYEPLGSDIYSKREFWLRFD